MAIAKIMSYKVFYVFVCKGSFFVFLNDKMKIWLTSIWPI